MAALAKNGINYVSANTSKPSDSFPGLTAIVTGGSPALTGVYYDVAYSRNLDGPKILTGNGNGPGPCTAGAPTTGFTTEYEEGKEGWLKSKSWKQFFSEGRLRFFMHSLIAKDASVGNFC